MEIEIGSVFVEKDVLYEVVYVWSKWVYGQRLGKIDAELSQPSRYHFNTVFISVNSI